jgi:hypothetical protein
MIRTPGPSIGAVAAPCTTIAPGSKSTCTPRMRVE